MGLMERREAVARVRVEELRSEAERVLAELAGAEAVLERRVSAVAELAEALTELGAESVTGVPVAEQVTEDVPGPVPVARSVVPRRAEGVELSVLAPDYRRIVELVENEPAAAGGEGVSAKEITSRFGLELVPAKIEGVRSRAKRLAERGWLEVSPAGRFTPRESAAPPAGR
ncbi:hypothetical protein QMF80_37835 [Streptomyces sp. G-G2]|nr:hypothetical protein [Streptomyces sp. G-G2]